MKLEKALKKASKKVWKELAPIANSNFKIHNVREEALSSMLLRTLAQSGCSNILGLEMIDSKSEKTGGYDFEMCIGNSKKKKFVRFFIQAKVLKGNYLNSVYKEYKLSQSNVLENYAKHNNGIPLYSLYNHLSIPELELYKYYNSPSKFNKKYLGVTISTTTKLKGGIKFDFVHDSGITDYYRFPLYRYHPDDILFYEDHIQSGVPLHDLANFSIEKAEEYNRVYKENKSKGIIPFFFFFFFDPELVGDNDELIPILNMSEEELVADFRIRTNPDSLEKKYEGYNPQSLIILEQEELYE